MTSVTVEELRNVVGVKGMPDDLLEWILDHTEYLEFEDGVLIRKFGDPANEMYFILEGSINFYMDVNGRQVYYFNFGNDVATGGISGLLPYSRMKTSPGYAYAVGKLRMLWMHKQHFPELERRSPEFIQRLVGYMTERARLFATIQLQHEKVNALGKLSAGIAHELNNPAAAINRISAELGKRVKLNYKLTEKLLSHGISAEHIQNIRNLVEAKEKDKKSSTKLGAMQRLENEDNIDDWFQKNGLEGNREAAETFAEARFSDHDLESILNNSGKDVLAQLIYWLENLLSSQRIIKDLEEASTRISTLVSAIKSHVHMDRTNELQLTNIHNDIDNTITLLGYKLREKNITVHKTYCKDLVDIPAYVGELNQVWTNIIDNAIYAVDKNGELTIETSCDKKNVKVKIIDNGSGIPKEIMSRIFDPFFTTKKVGQGTGIGLDLVSRIVKRHNGEIKVESAPGRTEFAVCIPVVAATDN
ncbi:MAG TPA: ATP-binding protein [Chitinophagaceae bacterium]|jgi:signal transduction histidine kinase|nr:ATP-binding protein [Chitinophagaceae bacterium]